MEKEDYGIFKKLLLNKAKKNKKSKSSFKIKVKTVKERKKTKKELERENARLRKKLSEPLDQRTVDALDYYMPRSGPVQAERRDGTGEYICPVCRAPAFYDGRCGDGPILMCGHG